MDMDIEGESDDDVELVVSGGRAVLRHQVRNALKLGIKIPIETFRSQLSSIEKRKRIRQTVKAGTLRDKANLIAEKLAKERAAEQRVLDGLIDDRTTKKCNALNSKREEDGATAKKLQSLEAKLANAEKKINKMQKNSKGGDNSSKQGKPASSSAKKNHVAAGRSKSTPQGRGGGRGRGTGGRSNAGRGAAKGGRGKNMTTKSTKKGRGTKTNSPK